MTTIGLEIGGTWLRGIALHPEGGVGDKVREPTPDDPAEVSDLLLSIWERLGGGGVVGLAAAPHLDVDGRIGWWPSMPSYIGTDILAPFTKKAIKLVVLDDVSAGAVAEHISATEDEILPSSSVLISIGTGVGAGAVLLDQPWTGATGRAMELGHIPVQSANNTACSCGEVGCLQAVASGKYLKRLASEAGISQEQLSDPTPHDPRVKDVLKSIAIPIAQAILIVDRLINPNRIILGGGLIESGILFDLITTSAKDHNGLAPILKGKWGTWAGAIGAAIEALRKSGQSLMKLYEGPGQPALRIALIQGPNLNLLGEREPEHYGNTTLKEIEYRMNKVAEGLNCHLYCIQSNSEGQLIEWLQNRGARIDGVILNPASLSAKGYGLRDILTATRVPFIEVHMSNIYAREGWHQESCFADVAIGRISGLLANGYELALRGLVDHLMQKGNKSHGD